MLSVIVSIIIFTQLKALIGFWRNVATPRPPNVLHQLVIEKNGKTQKRQPHRAVAEKLILQ